MFRLDFWIYLKIFGTALIVSMFFVFVFKGGGTKQFDIYSHNPNSISEIYGQDIQMPHSKDKSVVEIPSNSLQLPESLTRNPQKILVVTFWRSGSTWLGNALSKIPHSFYVYEPLHVLRYYWDDSRTNMYHGYKVGMLEQILNCVIPLEFVRHLYKWSPMYKNVRCPIPKCNVHHTVTRDCKKANIKIIKTNRLQLQEVEEILQKPTLKDLKVIYLVRDPRGIINSLRHIESKYIDTTIDEVCPRMRGDVTIYPVLKELYPNNFFFVRYEDLAALSLKKTKELWCFIHGKDNCPKMSQKFVQYLKESSEPSTEHTHGIGNFNTAGKSSRDWEIWREDIAESFLQSSESDCRDIIEDLGYRVFGTIGNARNLSVSSKLYENCTQVPCVS